ncbi:MAG: low molecular weight phosphotyrosine protein phosphatase [Gammaproteobacteria bacterium]|nr:low molecular weight phosphotyrosine protein phosphatase [Gammaproteobacteria bacterium]
MVNVLFVCMGNICRSPTAEGVFAKHVMDAGLQKKIGVDSAGTHAYHIGETPDPRSQKIALARGFDLSSLRARRAIVEDFDKFDYVLAMDNDNKRHLAALAPSDSQQHLRLFMEFAPHADVTEVPDPYYGGPLGFERVLDLIEAASEGLLQEIKKRHELLL